MKWIFFQTSTETNIGLLWTQLRRTRHPFISRTVIMKRSRKLVSIPVFYIKSEASDTKKLFCLFNWLLNLVYNPRWRELLAGDISERFQNEMLRRIFEWKRQKVTGDWKFYIIKIFGIYIPYEYEVAKWKGKRRTVHVARISEINVQRTLHS